MEINNLENYLKERIKDVDKCYTELIQPFYNKNLSIIDVSLMNKKEKEEFTNKRNCLLVQKHCYEEVLEKVEEER